MGATRERKAPVISMSRNPGIRSRRSAKTAEEVEKSKRNWKMNSMDVTLRGWARYLDSKIKPDSITLGGHVVRLFDDVLGWMRGRMARSVTIRCVSLRP